MNINESEADAARLVDERRYKEARRLLLELSEHGSIYSYLTLGWIYEQGVLGRKDIGAAKHWYERAVSVAYPEAYLRLGRLLTDQGELERARKAFEAGAKMRNLGSMYQLGKILLDDAQSPGDVEHGIAWLERAANDGHIYAQRRLVRLKVKNSKSLIGKILLIPLIVRTAINGVKEIRKDVYSDKVS